VDLARLVTASDVGAATVERVEHAVDDLAVAYPGTTPSVLLARTRAHLGYVTALLERRCTLAEHGRLLIAAGWLSLLAATSLIDLHRRAAALAHLRTAVQIARETGHAEITAWCLETRAWHLLITGDYLAAARLAQAAQRAAPRSGSALIQATAQEGRAWARLGAAPETREALARTEALVSALPQPDQPEHHYKYDPAKADSYVATTLSWAGDPAAVDTSRQVLARMESSADALPRPRRAALARLDLALALASTGQGDEAAAVAMEALTSGLIVQSSFWRAAEVIDAVDSHGAPGAADLREAYQEFASRRRSRPDHPDQLPRQPGEGCGWCHGGSCPLGSCVHRRWLWPALRGAGSEWRGRPRRGLRRPTGQPVPPQRAQWPHAGCGGCVVDMRVLCGPGVAPRRASWAGVVAMAGRC